MNLTMLNPRVVLFLIVFISTGIWSLHTPLFTYEKYYSLFGIMNYLLFYFIIWVFAWIAEKVSLNPQKMKPSIERFRRICGEGNSIRREAIVLGLIAFGAQMLWITRMVINEGLGPLIHLVFVEQDFQRFKLEVVNKSMISGITSFTQLGMISAALYGVYVFGLQRKSQAWIWLMILFPGILRGMFFSERLALMEVIIPIIVMVLVFNKIKLTFSKIVLLAAGFVGFFSIAEGLRSYTYYSKNGFEQEGVYAYGIGRFLDYISSSVNHSIAMVDLSNQTIAFPSLLFNGWLNLISIIVPSTSISTFLHTDHAIQAYNNVKSSVYSAPDYTNMGFFGHIFADSGYLYIFYAIIYGLILGIAYKGLRRYELGWLAVFPIIFISLLESYRIPYLFETRTFYPLLYIVMRYAFISVYKWKGELTNGARKGEANSY
jgi:hypothetical protein